MTVSTEQSPAESDSSKFPAQPFRLKEGGDVLLRQPAEADAEAMIDYLDELRHEAPGIMFSTEDALPTLNQEIEFIQSADGPDALRIVAEAEGRIVAVASVTGMKMYKTRHRAMLGIGILEAYRGQGLGRKMMSELLDFARRHPVIQQVELCVFADNYPAIALYIDQGFRRFGVLPGAFRQPDGTRGDELLMACRVDRPGPEPRHFERSLGDDAVLRQVRVSDAQAIYQLCVANREWLRPWFRWAPGVTGVGDVMERLCEVYEHFQRTGQVWGVIEKGGQIVGLAYMCHDSAQNRRTELGYWLDQSAVGHGYITKACRALIEEAFVNLRVNRIDITADVNNAPSRAVAERLGFQEETVIRQWLRFPDGRYVDMASYRLLKEDWQKKAEARS